jgi:hypothetical protein
MPAGCTRAFFAMSVPRRISLAGLLRASPVARLLLPFLIAHDTLIRTMRRFGGGLWHTLLATMFAALVLHAF